MTNGIAVLDDVSTLGGILNEYFMTSWGILIKGYLLVVDNNHFALLFGT